MTKSSQNLESSLMMSSVTPSEKYSCSGSPDILSNGSTAMEGLSGSSSTAALTRMSAFGYKQTYSGQLANVRFTPESGH